MSLEKALAENTAAIRSLIAALANPSVAYPIGDTVQASVTDNSASDTAEVSSNQAQPEVAAQEPVEAVSTEVTASAESVTYDDVAKVVSKLAATKGRDIAVGVLAKFNAKVLKDVDPSKFAEVIAACGAA